MNKSQTLITEVYSGEESWGGPTILKADLTPELRARIKFLSEKVKELNVYRIEEFDFSPDWYKGDMVSKEGIVCYDPEKLGDEVTMTGCLVHVLKDQFYWSGISREDGELYTSERFEIANLG